MTTESDVQRALVSALSDGSSGLAAADRLCRACVDLLAVDGAAVSVVDHGSTRGTFGSSSGLSRRLDDLQFTFGEGPCLDAVHRGSPVLVADLSDAQEQRWPAFAPAVLELGVRAVFALPVALASTTVGALDLFRSSPGPLTPDHLVGGAFAAHLAALPLLDLVGQLAARAGDDEGDGEQVPLADTRSLERVEVYQATGVLIARLEVSAAEALVRLRARAYAEGTTASDVAFAIVEHRLDVRPDGSWYAPGKDTR